MVTKPPKSRRKSTTYFWNMQTRGVFCSEKDTKKAFCNLCVLFLCVSNPVSNETPIKPRRESDESPTRVRRKSRIVSTGVRKEFEGSKESIKYQKKGKSVLLCVFCVNNLRI